MGLFFTFFLLIVGCLFFIKVFNFHILSIFKDYIIHVARTKLITLAGSGIIIRESNFRQTDLVYYDGQNKYSVRFPTRRGPRPFLRVADENEVDVTSTVIKFAGPYSNFHGIPTTPSILGFTSLRFTLRNEEEKIFKNDDIIAL